MPTRCPTVLFVSDRPFLSSLQFSLALDGFTVADGSRQFDPAAVSCLVVDQAWDGDGFDFVAWLKSAGCTAPAVLLVTNPTRAQRVRAAAASATIVEKPLMGDELTETLRRIVGARH